MQTTLLFQMAVADTVVLQTQLAGKTIVACSLMYHGFCNGSPGSLGCPIASELVSSRRGP